MCPKSHTHYKWRPTGDRRATEGPVGGWTRFPWGGEVGTTFVENGPTLSERCWIREHDNPKEAR
ncbi:hypothetical protein DPMN_187660 [Dreissena polymorpha]|uniref:Uncharacterized protein n=1 Tax=Dreissena polymorpha TaxID=45954 RepID=A0A9D4DR15_DREPO|nr:hypothetical protein DPMN_187660 [Dreissena polymorpha]